MAVLGCPSFLVIYCLPPLYGAMFFFFHSSLYAENNPKLGFQSAVLMKLLEDWANFDWDTRKCEFIDIIQSLEFLKEVSFQENSMKT